MAVISGNNIYIVKSTKVRKIVPMNFDNKMDAKDKRKSPLPYIVIKGDDHPIYKTYTNGKKN
jgi:hypothetical protein